MSKKFQECMSFMNSFRDSVKNENAEATASLFNNKSIDPLDQSDYTKCSLPELLNLATYRINKKLVYENHIKILTHHLNSDDKTTPKQLWPNRFPWPFLADNIKFLEEYDGLIIEMQQMIMNFIIKFINDNILTDLNDQINKIKLVMSALKSENKATKYIQQIHKEQNLKLKDSFDSKFFKALRYRGIPFKKLIENKKQVAEIKEKINSNKNTNKQINHKMTANYSSSNSDESVILVDDNFINKPNEIDKNYNFSKSILKKKNNLNSSRIEHKTHGRRSNNNNRFEDHSYRRLPNRSRSFKRDYSRSSNRGSRSRSRSRSFNGNHKFHYNRKNDTNRFGYINSNNSINSTFKPNNNNRFNKSNQYNSDYSDNNLYKLNKDHGLYDANDYSNRKDFNRPSVNFRLPASTRINR